jgi:hypothetical protein
VTFLTPLYAAVAAAIAVPSLVILYFLKLKRRDMEISSTLLWKKAIQDLQANAPFQKLRRNILLLLQLLALIAAILALGQPQINSIKTTGGRHVILIDRSASMNATDEEAKGTAVSRLEAAKTEALNFIQGLSEPGLIEKDAGDTAMVIAFDREASVVQQFTGDKRKLADAVRGITPTDGPSLLEPAVRLARAQAPRLILQDTRIVDGQAVTDIKVIEGISDRWPISLHVYTDGKLPDADRAVAGPSDTVEFHRFGKPDTHNIGIVAMRADREFDTPANVLLFAGLQNTDPAPVKVDVQLILEGTQGPIKEVTIPGSTDKGPGNAGVSFKFERPEATAAELVVRKADSIADSLDAFSTDDRAWLMIPPARGLRLALVSNGNLFLRQALAVLPQSGEPTLFTPAEYQAALKNGKAFEFDVTVVDGVALEWGDRKNTLPPGRFLIFNSIPNAIDASTLKPTQEGKNPDSLGAVLVPSGESGPSTIVSWQRDHPAFRSLNLDNLDIFKSLKAEIPTGSTAQVLGESTSGPVFFELITADARALVATFDPTSSDWPFDVSFIVFLSYSTDYLGTGGGWAVARSSQPGLTLSDRLPDKSSAVECTGPGGITVGAGLAPDGSASFGPFPKVGIYTASWTGPGAAGDVTANGTSKRRLAVNLLDPMESDIRAAQEIKLASTDAAARKGETGGSVRILWPWMLLAALAVVMLEWFIYNRKVHI